MTDIDMGTIIKQSAKKKALHTFHRGIPVRKCTFRWLSHKRRRFGNRTRYDNRDHKCRRDKVDGNGIQHSQACKYSLQSKDDICKEVCENVIKKVCSYA